MAKSKTTRKTAPALRRTKARPAATKRGKAGRAAMAKAAKATLATAPAKARPDSKQAVLIAQLRRKQGATIAELTEATGWQAHSVRGAISGTLKKKLGFDVTSAKVEGRGRVYRVV